MGFGLLSLLIYMFSLSSHVPLSLFKSPPIYSWLPNRIRPRFSPVLQNQLLVGHLHLYIPEMSRMYIPCINFHLSPHCLTPLQPWPLPIAQITQAVTYAFIWGLTLTFPSLSPPKHNHQALLILPPKYFSFLLLTPIISHLPASVPKEPLNCSSCMHRNHSKPSFKIP